MKKQINIPLPRGVRVELTRHGKTIYYYRSSQGGKRVRLPDDLKSQEFHIGLSKAMAGNVPQENRATGYAKSQFGWLVKEYMTSGAWNALELSTKRSRRLILAKIVAIIGQEKIEYVTVERLKTARDRRLATPGAANSQIKVLRALFKWAEEAKHVKENPALKVKPLKGSVDGFHTWTDKELRQFENCWAIGTRERLAYEIMLETGLRRSDVVLLSPAHIGNNELRINPFKTPSVTVTQTLKPEFLDLLRKSLMEGGVLGLTYVRTATGTPLKPESFTNWFRQACKAAGVKGSSHGLRKAAAVRLANNGATVNELLAFFGWTEVKQAQRYTEKADRIKLGRMASQKGERT